MPLIAATSIPPAFHRFPSTAALSAAIADHIAAVSDAAIHRHGRFMVAVSGGSLPALLFPTLRSRHPECGFRSWHVFMVDERMVPPDHQDSNYALIKRELDGLVPGKQIHGLTQGSWSGSADEAAKLYMQQLMDVFAHRETVRFPVFDAVLLGMGPDGHTASLFPGHVALERSVEWVAGIEDSPKPPSKRITLTLPVINHANHVMFVATGAGKREVMHRIIDNKDRSFPAALVQPEHAQVEWFLDSDAAGGITSTGVFSEHRL